MNILDNNNLVGSEEDDLFATFDEEEEEDKDKEEDIPKEKKKKTTNSAKHSKKTTKKKTTTKTTKKAVKKKKTEKKKEPSEENEPIPSSKKKKSSSKRKTVQDIIPKISNLLEELESYMEERYYNTHPVAVASVVRPKIKLPFTLPEMLLVGALSQSSVLLSGSSGTGKTYLCELMSYFLFGEQGYARKNITPDMNEQDFMDIDFGAIKEGKKLKEAMEADQLFSRPALILDEPNRAPPLIQNRLMQILENNIDLKSKTIHAGLPLPGGGYYHWDLLTLNFGEEYAGTTPVDRALRDRITIDIPIDNFPPSISDQILMIREKQVPFKLAEIKNRTQLVLEAHTVVENLNLNIQAEVLILYLSFCSACVKSQSKSKYGIVFSPQFCKDNDCPYARNPPLNAICPFTFAPSNRVLRKVVKVAKSFTLMRLAKTYSYLLNTKGKKNAEKYIHKDDNLSVTPQDVFKVAPFILNSKMGMIKEWVLNNFNGNTFFACKSFLSVIYKQVNYFQNNVLKTVIHEMDGKSISEKEKGIRNRALKQDFHFEGLIEYVKTALE